MMFWGAAAGGIASGFGGVSGLGSCCQCCQQRAMQEQFAHYLALPRKTIPAGITWERTGARQHRVTIRPEPEEVVDYNLALGGLSLDTQKKHEQDLRTYSM